jgi:hypothetical protein
MYDAKVLQRFWAKVDRNGPVPEHAPELGSCWIWTAAKVVGYGMFTLARGHQDYAHRTAWRIATQDEIPDGLFVCHKCDNRVCVRPHHLFLGDAKANAADRDVKGRWAGGRPGKGPGGISLVQWRKLHPRPKPVAEKHHLAKLTWAQVQEIRDRCQKTCITQKALASEYNISESLVSRIIHSHRRAAA